jgi:hypothetical protein
MIETPRSHVARRLGTVVVLGFVTATAAGCASRAAPFDKLDKAQVTIMRLQPKPQTTSPVPGVGGLQIPGLPPELQQMAQQTLDQLQQQGIIPPGLLPPGLGGTPGQPPPPQLPPYPRDPQWVIADQRPVVDPDLRDDLLDIFGDEDSFNANRGNCFYPAMAVSFQSPSVPEPVDVVVSFSCNQAVGYGFQWPHPQSGLAPKTSSKLAGIHQNIFGVPPS